MATPGQRIENPATGEVVTFVRVAAGSGGELLEMDDVWTRPGHRAAEHIHPEMEERFEIRSGAATFRVGGVERDVGPGDVVVVPPGTPHVAWSRSDDAVHLNIQFRPALRWEEFVVRLFTLAGEPDHGGPRLLELLEEFRREVVPVVQS